MSRSRATLAPASEPTAGSHPLDNVVWSALTGRQSELSEGDDRARRYLVDVAPMPPVEGLAVLLAGTGHQMIASRVAPPLQPRDFERLDDSAVPEMLALVERSQPGPFAVRTNRLGGYRGIRAGGQLIAMTGARMKIDGFTEISAVCTHPDHRGHGYAHDLVSLVAQAVLDRGEQPFLHVFSENSPAIALYERLGFAIRRTMHVTVVARKS